MLWGILNTVISARYISRKVSENCFVLLEQRLGRELTWSSWRFFQCHPSTASPAICTQPCPSLCTRRSLVESAALSQVLISAKKICIKGRISYSVALYSRHQSPLLIWQQCKKNLKRRGACVIFRCFILCLLLWFSVTLFLSCWLLNDFFSLMLSSSCAPASISPYIHPSGWGEVRQAGGRVEWSEGMERQLEPSQTRRDKLPL